MFSSAAISANLDAGDWFLWGIMQQDQDRVESLLKLADVLLEREPALAHGARRDVHGDVGHV